MDISEICLMFFKWQLQEIKSGTGRAKMHDIYLIQQRHAQQHSSTAPSPAPTYAPIAPGVVDGDGVGTAFNMK